MNMLSARGFAVLAFTVLLCFPLSATAQNAQNQTGQSGENQDTPNPETEQRQRALEGQEDVVVLESLRGLPYLTIEDTLRYQRELLGVFTPVRPDTSLLFTSWEHALLREMKKQVGDSRPVEEGDVGEQDSSKPREKGIREISLGGIVFVKDGDWTVWLNGQRVTPDAIPEQVLDMRVKNSYIEIKWFDSYTNLVYPLRLRPHQRFNLDNRIFLPGVAPSNNG